MNNVRGIVWAPILIMIGAVVAFGVMAYIVIKGYQKTTDTNTAVTNTTTNTVVTNQNTNLNTNSATNANAVTNTNTANTNSANTNQSASNPINIPGGWLTYTNTTYGYSIQYSPDYTPSGTAEKYQFRKGLLQGDATETFTVYALTEADRQVEGALHSGWYEWALNGFSINDNGQSTTEPRFSDKRQVTYGTNTYMVFQDDGFGTNNFTYFLVHGHTVYAIDDWRVGSFSESIVQAMLASFLPSDVTANWKTYSDRVHGFSFRYPADMTVTSRSDAISVSNSNNTTAAVLSFPTQAWDPNNIRGIYGKKDNPDRIKIGDQIGYGFGEGDAGCGGTHIQTNLEDNSILQVYFGKCDEDTNTWMTDISQRDLFLSTFQFTQ